MTPRVRQSSKVSESDTSAAWKASRLFSYVEAINVLRDDDNPGRYMIVVNTGPTDETIADDLDENVALSLGHALDVVYGCCVYDDEGRML